MVPIAHLIRYLVGAMMQPSTFFHSSRNPLTGHILGVLLLDRRAWPFLG
jgi:hypothetical protein